MNIISISENYYEKTHEFEFLTNAKNLFERSNIFEFLNKYNFTLESDQNKKYKMIHDMEAHIATDLDEFNFMIVRLAIFTELSLKGIALSKKLNIFNGISLKNNRGLADYRTIRIVIEKTHTMSFLLKNLSKILSEEQCKKYFATFKFINERRNDFIHFSRREYNHNSEEIIRHFKLLKDFYNEIVVPSRDSSSPAFIEEQKNRNI